MPLVAVPQEPCAPSRKQRKTTSAHKAPQQPPFRTGRTVLYCRGTHHAPCCVFALQVAVPFGFKSTNTALRSGCHTYCMRAYAVVTTHTACVPHTCCRPRHAGHRTFPTKGSPRTCLYLASCQNRKRRLPRPPVCAETVPFYAHTKQWEPTLGLGSSPWMCTLDTCYTRPVDSGLLMRCLRQRAALLATGRTYALLPSAQ
jgi:hypothetical protein